MSPPSRKTRTRRASGSGAAHPSQLVLALCHELGNLLAAARLSAFLLARESDPQQVRASAEDIEGIARHASALLGQARSLLAGDEDNRIRVAPGPVLEALSQAFDDTAGSLAPAVQQAAADLPPVDVDAEALHHVLVILTLAAREAAGAAGRVRISAGRAGRRVAFVVEDDGPPFAPDKRLRRRLRRGRALTVEVAEAIVGRWGGRVVVTPGTLGTRVELRLPAARPRA